MRSAFLSHYSGGKANSEADHGPKAADAAIGAHTADLASEASANGYHVESSVPPPVAANTAAPAAGFQAEDAESAASTNGNKPADGDQADTPAEESAESTASTADDGVAARKATAPASPVAAVTGWFSSALSAVTGTGKPSGQPAAAPEEDTQDTTASSATAAVEATHAPAGSAAKNGGENSAAKMEMPTVENGDTGTDTAAPAAVDAAGPQPGAGTQQSAEVDASAVRSLPKAGVDAATEQPTKSEIPKTEAAPASPVPGSIAAKIAKLRAGAAARSPDAPPPKFGLRLPFVTAESTAVGPAAAAAAGGAAASAIAADAGPAGVEAPSDPPADGASDAAEPPAVDTTAPTSDAAGDGSAAEASSSSSPADGVADDSAAADVGEGKPSPSPVRLVAQQVLHA